MLSRGNHHVIVRITDHDRHLRQVGNKMSKDTESLYKIESRFIGIVVALAVASFLIEQYPLCLGENLFREIEEKSPCVCMTKERMRDPALGEERTDQDSRIKDGAWHGRGDIL